MNNLALIKENVSSQCMWGTSKIFGVAWSAVFLIFKAYLVARVSNMSFIQILHWLN